MVKKLMMMALLVAGTVSATLAQTSGDEAGSGKKIRVLMAGDSTMQDVDHERNPDWGWGQVLPRYFTDKVEVTNLARGGRSSRTFIEEGRWDTLMGLAGEGDYIFIQFGHNDGAETMPERYSSPKDYKTNLVRFVNDARERGAVPILVTPVMRRNFDQDGIFYDVHGVYPQVVKEVAGAMNVTMIDLHEKSKWLIINHGIEPSRKLFMNVAPGEHPCCPEGRSDNTHFSEYGAMRVAGLIVDGIREQYIYPLGDYLLP